MAPLSAHFRAFFVRSGPRDFVLPIRSKAQAEDVGFVHGKVTPGCSFPKTAPFRDVASYSHMWFEVAGLITAAPKRMVSGSTRKTRNVWACDQPRAALTSMMAMRSLAL